MEFIEKYWEGLVALLALLTAVVSSFIAFYTFRLQRIHNIYSVKPILHIGQWDYENNLIISLKNAGNGIAIVKRLTVLNPKYERRNSIYDWLPKKLTGDMNYKDYWTPHTGFVVQSGETINLIDIPVDISDRKQLKERKKLRKIIGQLTVEVEYEDIYQNVMPIIKKQLVYFLRSDNEN